MIHRRRGLLLTVIGLVVVCSASMIVALRPELARNMSGAPSQGTPQPGLVEASQGQQTPMQNPPRQPGGTVSRPGDQAQAGGEGQKQNKKGATLEEMTAHLKRNMDRAVAQAAADGEAGSEASSEPIATSPEEATPDRPWPPRHLPAQRVDKSLMTPTPLPRKPRKDDHPKPPGNSVQILPGNPG